jgi:hypothetical protein
MNSVHDQLERLPCTLIPGTWHSSALRALEASSFSWSIFPFHHSLTPVTGYNIEVFSVLDGTPNRS